MKKQSLVLFQIVKNFGKSPGEQNQPVSQPEKFVYCIASTLNTLAHYDGIIKYILLLSVVRVETKNFSSKHCHTYQPRGIINSKNIKDNFKFIY